LKPLPPMADGPAGHLALRITPPAFGHLPLKRGGVK